MKLFSLLCRAKIENPGRFAMWFRRLSGVRVVALALVLFGGSLGGLPDLLGAWLGAGTGAARAQATSDIFTVRDVPVDETAATAAEARQVALAAGQRRAFRRLMDRLVPEDQMDLVPKLDSNLLQYYVLDFSVADERTSSVRYLADVTFRFNAAEVRGLLRSNNVGFAETRSKPVVVLPVFQAQDTPAALWLDPNPWRESWAQRPSDDGLVPMVVPLGDLGDIGAIDAQRALAADPEALRSIATVYGAEDVLVTEATLSGNPADGSAVLSLVTRRFRDGVNTVTLRDKLVQVTGEPYAAFLTRGADRVDNAIQEAWKQQNLLQFGSQRTILVFVPLEGLDDWLNVRRRLHGLAVIQQTGLNTLTRSEAQLEITFVGDEQRLSRALEQHDLFLALRQDSNWELLLAEKRYLATPEAPQFFPAPESSGTSPAPDNSSAFPAPAPQ